MAELLFYVLSAIALLGGVGVLAARAPLASLLSLLATFVSLAGIYLLAGFPFLAMAQVITYAGAILVLFLYVIMLLDLDDPTSLAQAPVRVLGRRKVAIAGLAAGALVAASVLAIGIGAGDPEATPIFGIDSLMEIATLLYTRYALAFQAIGMLLLLTMIGVMLLAKRERRDDARSSGNLYPFEVAGPRSPVGSEPAAPPAEPAPPSALPTRQKEPVVTGPGGDAR